MSIIWPDGEASDYGALNGSALSSLSLLVTRSSITITWRFAPSPWSAIFAVRVGVGPAQARPPRPPWAVAAIVIALQTWGMPNSLPLFSTYSPFSFLLFWGLCPAAVAANSMIVGSPGACAQGTLRWGHAVSG